MAVHQTTPKEARNNYQAKKNVLQDGLLAYIENKILTTFPFVIKSTEIRVEIPGEYHKILDDFSDDVVDKYTKAGWNVIFSKTSNGTPVLTLNARDKLQTAVSEGEGTAISGEVGGGVK